jgi:hypothetical protein
MACFAICNHHHNIVEDLIFYVKDKNTLRDLRFEENIFFPEIIGLSNENLMGDVNCVVITYEDLLKNMNANQQNAIFQTFNTTPAILLIITNEDNLLNLKKNCVILNYQLYNQRLLKMLLSKFLPNLLDIKDEDIKIIMQKFIMYGGSFRIFLKMIEHTTSKKTNIGELTLPSVIPTNFIAFTRSSFFFSKKNSLQTLFLVDLAEKITFSLGEIPLAKEYIQFHS